MPEATEAVETPAAQQIDTRREAFILAAMICTAVAGRGVLPPKQFAGDSVALADAVLAEIDRPKDGAA